jgi:hypothetical protein
MTPEKRVDAEALFDAWRAWSRVDWAMYEQVCAIFGDNVEDVAHDDYDRSLEIYIKGDLVPTQPQVETVLAMGFAKFWINFPDETEICCGRLSDGIVIEQRKKRQYSKWRDGGRKAPVPEGRDSLDAKRYRWLNDKFELLLKLRDDTPIGGYRPPMQHVRLRCGEALDHWIDEKIEAERSAPQGEP